MLARIFYSTRYIVLNPHVAIVILNWNGRDYLKKFLPFVFSSTYSDFEVVIIDNASTDDSIAILKSDFPNARIIELAQNYGFAKGYNLGLKEITADYYVLLNSDVETSPRWIEPIISLMESDKQIAACMPKILQYHNRSRFEYAGAAGGWIDHLGYPFARGRIFDYCETDIGQYDNTRPVFWASGAAMFVRSEVYHQLGGLDEFFFAHQEEIDFCWRLQLEGYKVYCCPESIVYHVGGGTLPKGNSRKVFLNFRNNLIMLAKNLPRGEAFLKITLRFQLDAVSAVKSLFAGEGTYFLAVIKAHFAFMRWLISKKDKRFIARRKNTTWTGYFPESVIWGHFIRRKKKFTEIVKRKDEFLN